MRLHNMKALAGDNTMTLESNSIRVDEGNMSMRSGSSEGSANKRGIKSNIALRNKQEQMQN